jgi:hypothetical protein
MAELNRMTGAGIEIKIGDDKYKISPLRMKELGELEKWAEQRIFNKVNEELEMIKNSGIEINDDIKLKLIKDASNKSKSQYDKSLEMQTIDGLKKILELSLSIKHKHITDEDINKITEQEGLEQINKVIDSLSYPTEEESKELKKD